MSTTSKITGFFDQATALNAKALSALDRRQERLDRDYADARAKLCRTLSSLTRNWADAVEGEIADGSKLYKGQGARGLIAGALVQRFWDCNVHDSTYDFTDKVSAQGFNLSQPLFFRYRDHGFGPAHNRLVPFMRAMAGYGVSQAERLEAEYDLGPQDPHVAPHLAAE